MFSEDMVLLMLRIIGFLFASIPMHELGHYLVAKRLKWNPKITYSKWAVQIETEPVEIKDVSEFPKFYVQVATFRIMGSVFSILTLLFLSLFGLYTTELLLDLTILLFLYGVWEVTDNPCKKEKM